MPSMSDSSNQPAQPITASGRYYDGKVAAGRHVLLTVADRSLGISTPGRQLIDTWALSEINPVEPDDTGTARIGRTGSAATVACDDAALLAALQSGAGGARRHRTSNWPKVAAWICGALAAVALFFWFGLPLIAHRAAQSLPEAWERKLGVSAAEQIAGILSRRNPQACDAAEGQAAMNRLVGQLTAATPPRLPIHVRVVDTDMVNALTLPGGEVLVLRGLLDFTEHPNELAAVLAHEFGHSDLAHPTENVIKRGGGALAVGVLMGDVFGGSTVVILAQTMIAASYTREAETQADDRMLETMRRANLQTPPAAGFFDRLVKKEGSATGLFKLLETHPPSADRADRLRNAVPQGSDALSPTEWLALKKICGAATPKAQP